MARMRKVVEQRNKRMRNSNIFGISIMIFILISIFVTAQEDMILTRDHATKRAILLADEGELDLVQFFVEEHVNQKESKEEMLQLIEDRRAGIIKEEIEEEEESGEPAYGASAGIGLALALLLLFASRKKLKEWSQTSKDPQPVSKPEQKEELNYEKINDLMKEKERLYRRKQARIKRWRLLNEKLEDIDKELKEEFKNAKPDFPLKGLDNVYRCDKEKFAKHYNYFKKELDNVMAKVNLNANKLIEIKKEKNREKAGKMPHGVKIILDKSKEIEIINKKIENYLSRNFKFDKENIEWVKANAEKIKEKYNDINTDNSIDEAVRIGLISRENYDKLDEELKTIYEQNSNFVAYFNKIHKNNIKLFELLRKENSLFEKERSTENKEIIKSKNLDKEFTNQINIFNEEKKYLDLFLKDIKVHIEEHEKKQKEEIKEEKKDEEKVEEAKKEVEKEKKKEKKKNKSIFEQKIKVLEHAEKYLRVQLKSLEKKRTFRKLLWAADSNNPAHYVHIKFEIPYSEKFKENLVKNKPQYLSQNIGELYHTQRDSPGKFTGLNFKQNIERVIISFKHYIKIINNEIQSIRQDEKDYMSRSYNAESQSKYNILGK